MRENDIRIIIDNREKPSGIESYFPEGCVNIEYSQLDVADYVCSDRVAIERKTVNDFISSIKDNRLFEQMKNLRASYEAPILVIEGGKNEFFDKGVHKNSIRGALSSICVDYKMPIIWTLDTKDTALQILQIAKKEQLENSRTPAIRVLKKKNSTKDMQEFLISGLPDINSVLSRKLLEAFGSPKALFDADISELLKIEGIGREKAKKIFEILNMNYY